MKNALRRLLLALPVAAALAFGVTQAAAAPRSGCNGADQVKVSSCGAFGDDCGRYCPSGVGFCESSTCCRCQI
ncbi:MAG: hypothetical protein KY467_08215 [Gemmatimonadetes bacterium]|nr:hypothetical protein [Gemmatimonadota bacterium]